MIDCVSVVSHGGLVLWKKQFSNVDRRPAINALIQEVLIEDRAADKEYIWNDVKIRWVLANEDHFTVVAIYQNFLQHAHIDKFLQTVRRLFSEKFPGVASRDRFALPPSNIHEDFTKEFMAYFEQYQKMEKGEVSRLGSGDESDVADQDERDASADDGRSSPAPVESVSPNKQQQGSSSPPAGTFVTASGRTIGKRGATKDDKKSNQPPAPAAGPKKPGKPQKQPSVSFDKPVKDASPQATAAAPTAEEMEIITQKQRDTFIKRTADGKVAPVLEREWEGKKRGLLATWLRSYVGTRELDEQDFLQVIPNLREKLITKNVAVEIAETVCSSVQASIAGTKLGTFDSLHKTIEEAMTTALKRILQPKHEVNILRSVASAVARHKPYSIVFCGVNGVGKSTSLAKMAYWLQQNGHSILIAAGDTFRHGAVEQLEVHGRCLGIPVYQHGYGADPSAVAGAAIAQAARQNTHVVLIDTAGRMQDHESRMRALAKLIHDNQPELVLFVGEALVGNNGVDQLRKFNQCLYDFAPVGVKPRGIDGIVLTKFDTIDDKVGAAVTMVYELGQPIVFVGVGQTYQDLKVIEADVVVSALMQ